MTRSGLIRLAYQNPDNKWSEISAELKNTGSSDKVLTHAAITPTPCKGRTGFFFFFVFCITSTDQHEASIIIATHSTAGRICIYRVVMVWNPAQWDPNQTRQAFATQQFPLPSFHIAHCKVDMPSHILSSGNNRLSAAGEEGPEDPSSPVYNLTQLHVFSRPQESQNAVAAGPGCGPYVVAVFSSPLHVIAESSGQQQRSSSSVIVRWQFRTGTQVLHPKFDEVISKRNGGKQANVFPPPPLFFYDNRIAHYP